MNRDKRGDEQPTGEVRFRGFFAVIPNVLIRYPTSGAITSEPEQADEPVVVDREPS